MKKGDKYLYAATVLAILGIAGASVLLDHAYIALPLAALISSGSLFLCLILWFIGMITGDESKALPKKD